jgi:hypothetical protein
MLMAVCRDSFWPINELAIPYGSLQTHMHVYFASRRECRCDVGVPVVTLLVCLPSSHTRLRVRSVPGIPCALFFRGMLFLQNSGAGRAAGTLGCVSILSGPSFETPACGGLLRMRSTCEARSQTLMVRSRKAASRTMRPRGGQPNLRSAPVIERALTCAKRRRRRSRPAQSR